MHSWFMCTVQLYGHADLRVEACAAQLVDVAEHVALGREHRVHKFPLGLLPGSSKRSATRMITRCICSFSFQVVEQTSKAVCTVKAEEFIAYLAEGVEHLKL